MGFIPCLWLPFTCAEFKVVSVLKKSRHRQRPPQLPRDQKEDNEDTVSVSSSQLSCTSYEDGETGIPRQLGLCTSYSRKSCDELLEEAYDATKYVLGLGTQPLSEGLGEVWVWVWVCVYVCVHVYNQGLCFHSNKVVTILRMS